MTETPAPIQWYSGYTRYDQPRRLFWDGHWLEIQTVLARAAYPHGAGLTVLTAGRRRFRLDYDAQRDLWYCSPLP